MKNSIHYDQPIMSYRDFTDEPTITNAEQDRSNRSHQDVYSEKKPFDIDQSTKLFNSAVIASKAMKFENYSQRLNVLLNSPEFQCILKAIHQYAKDSGLSEEEAAEKVIQTFREIDSIWEKYIQYEGLEKLRSLLTS